MIDIYKLEFEIRKRIKGESVVYIKEFCGDLSITIGKIIKNHYSELYINFSNEYLKETPIVEDIAKQSAEYFNRRWKKLDKRKKK